MCICIGYVRNHIWTSEETRYMEKNVRMSENKKNHKQSIQLGHCPKETKATVCNDKIGYSNRVSFFITSLPIYIGTYVRCLVFLYFPLLLKRSICLGIIFRSNGKSCLLLPPSSASDLITLPH